MDVRALLAAPQLGLRMARGRGFAHGMASVAMLVMGASTEASPRKTHTRYPSYSTQNVHVSEVLT